jgi:hypothetical protein
VRSDRRRGGLRAADFVWEDLIRRMIAPYLSNPGTSPRRHSQGLSYSYPSALF